MLYTVLEQKFHLFLPYHLKVRFIGLLFPYTKGKLEGLGGTPMETRYFNVTCARHENHVVLPAKKAVGEGLCASNPCYQRRFTQKHSNIIDFTAYRDAMLEEEAEDFSTEEVDNVDASSRLSLRDLISLSLECVATGGILAMAVAMIVIFI